MSVNLTKEDKISIIVQSKQYLNKHDHDILNSCDTVKELFIKDSNMCHYISLRCHLRDEVLDELFKYTNKRSWWKMLNGISVLHRDDDLPAVISDDGTLIWAIDGQYHREDDKPAYIGGNGTKQWYYKGKLHRKYNLPAVMSKNRYEFHYNGTQVNLTMTKKELFKYLFSL